MVACLSFSLHVDLTVCRKTDLSTHADGMGRGEELTRKSDRVGAGRVPTCDGPMSGVSQGHTCA